MILFDGATFDADLDDFSLTPNGWAMKIDATAIVLAGGLSKRMGRDKSMLMIEGKPMIQHICDSLRPWFREILVSANDASRYAFLNLPVIGDRLPGQGPLMGIASTMAKSVYDHSFVTACDIPRIDTALMLKMLRMSRGFDGIVPRGDNSQYEPLFAVYRKTMMGTFNKLLAAGERKIDRAYPLCRMGYADLPPQRTLTNINTMQDYMTLSRDDKDVAV
jgi:molybdopterin-guanine dinucleotide biosynthesis protein A